MKKILSIILALVLCLSTLTVASSAKEDTPFYLVLGDSIAYGSGLGNPTEACYGKIVADTNGYDYTNYAVPGHTTTNLISRLEQPEVVEALQKADIISISIGGNDFLLGNLMHLIFNAMVLNDYTPLDTIASKFFENFSTIVDIINEHNPDAVILMQTLYNPQSGYLREPYQMAADRLNAEIRRFAEENPGEIVVVDVGTALGDDPANFASDDIHPSANGNMIIAQEVLDALYENDLGKTNVALVTTPATDINIPEYFTAFLDIIGFVFNLMGSVYDFVSQNFYYLNLL